jgi:outer membrane protein assembly factor BamD (BamD/ComL family)
MLAQRSILSTIKHTPSTRLTYNIYIILRLAGLLMAKERQRPLKVFLCHASGDKPTVRGLYQRLIRDGVDAWLDKEKLLPGQDWQSEISKAVRESDVVIVCLSNKSITKEGYIQKELKFALDIASEKPEGTIFLIPARLEECDVPPRLAPWQWVDLFEADGYERLMRSLHIRAEKLGMRVGETVYTDREVEQRLDQLYTDGLAALWVEDWDKAYLRFQAILREKPDHVQAIAKLDEAKRQKHFDTLYRQALDAQQNGDWQAVVDVLEKLTSEISDYKDVSVMLKNARKKHQLAQLYQEAQRLHKAEQWQAVIRVFDQITGIDSVYPDPEGLLPSAQKEAAELKRLADLNELYRRGVHKMDAGEWYEARDLLEQVHKAQTGFLDTERVLRKVENEITKTEELNKRNIYVNTLYEQAHELIRSKNWGKALAKIEEIQALDGQFEDRDRIFEKVRAELTREEETVQRQNQLAAMYTEAVRLLKDGKYQEALDQWQAIKTLDPKYPDRQKVQATARKSLQNLTKLHGARVKIPAWGWILLSLVILAGGLWIAYMRHDQALAVIEKHSCPSIQSDVVNISSNWSQVPVLIDGKITYGSEWSDASCISFRLYQGGNTDVLNHVDSQWYVKNDGEWLYILRRTPNTFEAEGIFVGYYYPYPYTDRWQNSDAGGYSFGAEEPFDLYGWDETRFYADAEAEPPGSIDVQAAATQDENFMWFEMRKKLNSGDVHDWKWNPGMTVGTGETGNLILGGRGRKESSQDVSFYAHPIRLVLAAQKQE